ncbi:MAG: hypothetical protein K5Q00_00990 [Gammaproteobacteria bacterium]|nr:hypothetical protein [Gammaproteobacteria bacterium]
MKYSNWIGAMLLLCSSALLADQPSLSLVNPLPVQTSPSFDWHNLADQPTNPPCPAGKNCNNQPSNICVDLNGNVVGTCLAPAVCCGRAMASSFANDQCISPYQGQQISDCCTQNGQDPGSAVVGYCTGGAVCDYSHPGFCKPPSAH